MSGLFIGLAVTAGFILGVRVGFALARREDQRRARLRTKKSKAS